MHKQQHVLHIFIILYLNVNAFIFKHKYFIVQHYTSLIIMVSDKLHEVASAEGVKTGMMAVLYMLTLYTCIKGQGFHCAATNAVFSCFEGLPPSDTTIYMEKNLQNNAIINSEIDNQIFFLRIKLKCLPSVLKSMEEYTGISFVLLNGHPYHAKGMMLGTVAIVIYDVQGTLKTRLDSLPQLCFLPLP